MYLLYEKGQDLSESFSAQVSMFCDASSESYGGCLEFNTHHTSEGKRPVIKGKGTCSRYSTDVGRSSQPHVYFRKVF